MSDPNNFRMRVFFRKTGRLALLSHLEIARALERAVRRAGLPYAISQGFSPHMKIAFGAALPVGVGGARECFDLQLTRYVAPEKILASLQEKSADDLMVLECAAIGPKVPAASVAFPISTYRVELSAPLPCVPKIPEAITVIRKKKEKELVVADYLQGDVIISDADDIGGAVDAAGAGGTLLEFTLEAKPTGSLRPDRFVQALLETHPDVSATSITRIEQRSF